MAATSIVVSYHGPSGTTTNIGGIEVRYKWLDNDTADLEGAIAIPASTSNYSYPKFMKIQWATTPAAVIRNLFTFVDSVDDGDPALDWDGLSMWVGITSTYVQAGLTDSFVKRSACTMNMDTYTAYNPLRLTADGVTVLANPNVGVGTQPYVMTQLEVKPTAINGVKAQRSLFYKWDEI